ncbi:MAG: hypothetical protein ACI8S6_005236 [Myxococcota bacterium]|jgi:hypothetical protein
MIAAPVGLWSTLLGLQLAAMGGYLLALVALGRRDVLRPLLLARLPLAIGTAWLVSPTLALVEGGLALLAWASLGSGEGTERLNAPSRLHNVVLGLFPLVEGVACLLAAPAVSALLYEAPSVQPWAALFGLQSLYLAVFWWCCVGLGCWSGLAVTIIGRLGVAVTFGILWWGGGSVRLGLLAAALAVSCVWSGREALRRPA